jgi:hypothetical protein
MVIIGNRYDVNVEECPILKYIAKIIKVIDKNRIGEIDENSILVVKACP